MDEATKVLLLRLGYRIQDMEAKFGPHAFKGRWRWVNLRTGEHQDDNVVSLSEADAWRRATEHSRTAAIAA